MKKIGWLIFLGFIFHWSMSWSQEFYQWVDDRGIPNFADDLGRVPEKYRNQVRERKQLEKSSPSLSPQSFKGTGNSEPPPDQPAERKDVMGRGGDWWKAKAREWNERLLVAEKNYETAAKAYKSKEKELEGAKFKPKSFQRKITSEVKALEEKMNDWKKKKEEAKNMLEKGLPQEAAEHRADPDWLRID